MAGLVKQTPGAIGYVELVYAMQNKISYGAVQNMDGEFVKASHRVGRPRPRPAAAAKMPADFRVSITNAPGKDAYPISSFTWLLFYENPEGQGAGEDHGRLHEVGADRRPEVRRRLGYAPLPAAVVKIEMEALKKIKIQ